MGGGVWLNVLYIILLKLEMHMIESSFRDIAKMKNGTCLNSFIRYENERWCMAECILYNIIEMGDGIYLNSLYMILLKWVGIYPNALYIILLNLEMIYIWMFFIWYYQNNSCYTPECSLYDVIKMNEFVSLNALFIVFLKWQIIYV